MLIKNTPNSWEINRTAMPNATESETIQSWPTLTPPSAMSDCSSRTNQRAKARCRVDEIVLNIKVDQGKAQDESRSFGAIPGQFGST